MRSVSTHSCTGMVGREQIGSAGHAFHAEFYTVQATQFNAVPQLCDAAQLGKRTVTCRCPGCSDVCDREPRDHYIKNTACLVLVGYYKSVCQTGADIVMHVRNHTCKLVGSPSSVAGKGNYNNVTHIFPLELAACPLRRPPTHQPFDCSSTPEMKAWH